MDPESRRFTARLLVAASGALFAFGWGFLRAGTGEALFIIGLLALLIGLAFDRSRGTILIALAALAIVILVPALLVLPAAL